MWSDILLIIIFIIINGFFAAAEISVVATRRIRIRQLIEEGNKNALILKKFKEEPDRFLATIQIGITFAGVFAAAIGGATAVKNHKTGYSGNPAKTSRCFG
jgi:putative hemolysin